ncbi:hypothetical protein CRYUN_Cryun16bG0083500 [Craigia yunnanensis]
MDVLQHFSHEHALVFIKDWNPAIKEEEQEAALCFGCDERVEGPSYCCISCRLCMKFVFHCAFCDFNLDINCALPQLFISGRFHKLEHFFHEHPLIFNEKHNKKVGFGYCFGCRKPLSGQIYRCLDCSDFDLHKECAELSLEINHPYHRKHPLTLLPNPPTHQEGCCCYFCKTEWRMGFVYHCSICKFGLTLEDVLSLPIITVASHEHSWILVSRPISFICDACGTDGDYAPYQCITCNLFVHKNCISLPRTIKITRHQHQLSHTYFLQQNQSENWECRICHKEVNTEYGSYYCSVSGCNYIAHANCATNKHIWDETVVLEDIAEGSKGALHASMNMITNVIKEMRTGEDVIATEIKHAYHDHNLRLALNGEVKDDNICDGSGITMDLPTNAT